MQRVSNLENEESRLQLLANLRSSFYPCPICSRRTRDTDKIGMLELRWDIEYDEYYPSSASPYLVGECQDEQTGFGVVRPRSIYRIGGMLPYNHAEQINEMADDGQVPEELAYILGAAQERRRILESLGIQVKTWGDI